MQEGEVWRVKGREGARRKLPKSLRSVVYIIDSTNNLKYVLGSYRQVDLLLLKCNPSKQHSKVLYRCGVRGKGKAQKTRKSRSKEKVVGFSSASLFPERKREAVNQGGTRDIDHTTRRKNPGR